MKRLSFVELTGKDAFNANLSVLKPKNCDNGNEFWFKWGHSNFVVGTITDTDSLVVEETALPVYYDELGNRCNEEPNTRYRTGKIHTNGYEFLMNRCHQYDGGLFGLFSQPIGNPIADCVTETDDIGVENDGLSLDEQKELLQKFTGVTNLEPAIVLTSGGSSLHVHYKTDEHLPLDQARYLRRLAIVAFLSDPVTERWHQPMRFGGGFRKEKGKHQSVLYVNPEARYTFEQLVEGFRSWFEYKGWEFPEAFTDDWWRERFYSKLKGSAKLSTEQKEARIREALDQGLDSWQAVKDLEERERQIRVKQQRDCSSVGQLGSLVDLVNETSDRLGASVFQLFSHGWIGKPNHKRGRCSNPSHQSKSGNSAWIAPNKYRD